MWVKATVGNNPCGRFWTKYGYLGIWSRPRKAPMVGFEIPQVGFQIDSTKAAPSAN